MPALHIFNQRLVISSDDLVFPGLFACSIRLGWVAGLLATIVNNGSFWWATAVYISMLGLSSVGLVMEMATVAVASTGTPLQLTQRKAMPALVRAQLVLFVLEVSVLAVGSYWAFGHDCEGSNGDGGCNDADQYRLELFMIAGWSLVAFVICSFLLAFDFSHPGDGSSPILTKTAYAKGWKRCCSWMCCFAGDMETTALLPGEEHHQQTILTKTALEVVSWELANYFDFLDCVPSDFLLGLVLLRRKQKKREMEAIATLLLGHGANPFVDCDNPLGPKQPGPTHQRLEGVHAMVQERAAGMQTAYRDLTRSGLAREFNDADGTIGDTMECGTASTTSDLLPPSGHVAQHGLEFEYRAMHGKLGEGVGSTTGNSKGDGGILNGTPRSVLLEAYRTCKAATPGLILRWEVTEGAVPLKSTGQDLFALEEVDHFFQFAFGVYGAAILIYSDPCCGLCRLCRVQCGTCVGKCCDRPTPLPPRSRQRASSATSVTDSLVSAPRASCPATIATACCCCCPPEASRAHHRESDSSIFDITLHSKEDIGAVAAAAYRDAESRESSIVLGQNGNLPNSGGRAKTENDRLLHIERAAMQSVLYSGTALRKYSHKRETGVREIVDSDWTNVVGVTPYAICVDHSKGAVVVSVRGTLSFSDCLTDAVAMEEPLAAAFAEFGLPKGIGSLADPTSVSDRASAVWDHQCTAHSGMLQAAVRLRRELENTGILAQLLHRASGGHGGVTPPPPTARHISSASASADGTRTRAPRSGSVVYSNLDPALLDRCGSYSLVVVGHSLGAGVASLLSVLLRHEFPAVRCMAYSPPLLMSEPLARY
jgi:hypothetical protein